MKKEFKDLEKELNKLKKNRKIFTILGYTFLGLGLAFCITSILCFNLIYVTEGNINVYGQIFLSFSGVCFTASIILFLLRFFLYSVNIRFYSNIVDIAKKGNNNNVVVDAKYTEKPLSRDEELLNQYKELYKQGIISEEDYKKKEEELTHSSINPS